MINPKDKRVIQVLKTFKALPRKGKGFEITVADLISLEQVQKWSDKSAFHNPKLWSKTSLFVKVDTMVRLYKSLTDEGRESMAQDELLGGWFVGDGDPENEDDDGDFCSTPCLDEEVPTVAEFRWALEDCGTGDPAVLFLY
jgi:hypothetical protein